MRKPFLILVCSSTSPNQVGEVCCSQRNADNLLQAFQKRVKVLGMEEKIEVRESGCMNNCRRGASVKVFPGNLLYSEVSLPDIDEILSGIQEGKAVKRLRTERINRFLGF